MVITIEISYSCPPLIGPNLLSNNLAHITDVSFGVNEVEKYYQNTDIYLALSAQFYVYKNITLPYP